MTTPAAPSRTTLADTRTTPRYAGICTFGRYPMLENAGPEARPLDWLIYGVPFDSGVTYRPGARFGPRAIREESQYLKRYHTAHRVDVPAVLSLADAGDAPIKPYGLRETLLSVRSWAAGLNEPHAKLLALGGDHSIAYANIGATFDRLGKPSGGLALIHFDSHLDTVDSVWGEKWGHASPFIRCIEEGLIDPGAMLSIGVKGPLNTAADLHFAIDRGVTLVTREELGEADGRERIRRFISNLGSRPVYITFDIDVVDPAFAPGTGTPSVGGITSSEALSLLRSLRGINVVGGDVVEVLPDRDHAGITSLLAAHIAFEILALDAAGTRVS